MHTRRFSEMLFGVIVVALTGLFLLVIGLPSRGQEYGLIASAAEQSDVRGTPTPISAINRSTPLTTTTPTPSETPTETPTGFLSVTVDVMPAATLVPYGAPLTVAVVIRDESEGCQFPILDLTLSQEGENAPLFRYDSPAVLQAPGSTGMYTLTATAPGVVIFAAEAYGEINCGDAWVWHYERGYSGPVTVSAPAGFALLPLVFAAEEQR